MKLLRARNTEKDAVNETRHHTDCSSGRQTFKASFPLRRALFRRTTGVPNPRSEEEAATLSSSRRETQGSREEAKALSRRKSVCPRRLDAAPFVVPARYWRRRRRAFFGGRSKEIEWWRAPAAATTAAPRQKARWAQANSYDVILPFLGYSRRTVELRAFSRSPFVFGGGGRPSGPASLA